MRHSLVQRVHHRDFQQATATNEDLEVAALISYTLLRDSIGLPELTGPL